MVFENNFLRSKICASCTSLKTVQLELALRLKLKLKNSYFGVGSLHSNMAETVKSSFLVRVENYFDSRFSSFGAIPIICESLRKYDL